MLEVFRDHADVEGDIRGLVGRAGLSGECGLLVRCVRVRGLERLAGDLVTWAFGGVAASRRERRKREGEGGAGPTVHVGGTESSACAMAVGRRFAPRRTQRDNLRRLSRGTRR